MAHRMGARKRHWPSKEGLQCAQIRGVHNTSLVLRSHCMLPPSQVLQLAAGSPPSDELLIAARGQHVRRWAMPRSSYAEGRAPYLKWREDLKKMSTMTVIDFMKEEGFGPHACEKARTACQSADQFHCRFMLASHFVNCHKRVTDRAASWEGGSGGVPTRCCCSTHPSWLAQVEIMMMKKNFKDDECQLIEDALCLGENWPLVLL